MLFQLRKENLELNDEYNKMINEKAKLEIEYLEIKKRLENYVKKKNLRIMSNLSHLKFLLN
jgi:hypothetical protein